MSEPTPNFRLYPTEGDPIDFYAPSRDEALDEVDSLLWSLQCDGVFREIVRTASGDVDETATKEGETYELTF